MNILRYDARVSNHKGDTLQNSKKTQSKAGFIRAQSMDLSAAEVVKKAKEAGISVTAQTVHATRSAYRQKLKTGKVSARAAGPVVSAKASGSQDQDSAQFVRLVAAIGLRRAEVLLSEVKAKLSAIA